MEYRIKEYTYYNNKSYVVQKKSILGFWYNPDNINADITGCYDTQKEAEETIKAKLFKVTSRIINSGIKQ